jgi:hypothetical protein
VPYLNLLKYCLSHCFLAMALATIIGSMCLTFPTEVLPVPLLPGHGPGHHQRFHVPYLNLLEYCLFHCSLAKALATTLGSMCLTLTY